MIERIQLIGNQKQPKEYCTMNIYCQLYLLCCQNQLLVRLHKTCYYESTTEIGYLKPIYMIYINRITLFLKIQKSTLFDYVLKHNRAIQNRYAMNQVVILEDHVHRTDHKCVGGNFEKSYMFFSAYEQTLVDNLIDYL